MVNWSMVCLVEGNDVPKVGKVRLGMLQEREGGLVDELLDLRYYTR